MMARQAITMLAAMILAGPAAAALVVPQVPVQGGVVAVQDKGDKAEEHGKKQAKGKAKHEDGKKNDRSNKGGATRGGERSDQVQGMQDTGKGAGKRP
jgi:hypothetical protein